MQEKYDWRLRSGILTWILASPFDAVQFFTKKQGGDAPRGGQGKCPNETYAS